MTGIDYVPLWLFFVSSIAIVLGSMDAGHRVGASRRLRSGMERENATAVISAGLVGLNSFFLAFVFGMAADRYEDRQRLVREDAAAIRVAFFRTGLLQEDERTRARALLREYLEERIAAVASRRVDVGYVSKERTRLQDIQRQLWTTVEPAHAGRDRLAGTYLDALDHLIVVDVQCWAAGYETRLPAGVWLLLGALNMFAMFGMGFLVGNSGSRHSLLTPALALAFAIVLTLIAVLDRPDGHVAISQQPLLDLRAYLATGPG